MIKQYQGGGITTYTLRSGTEVTLSVEDFEEMLGFKDDMDRLRIKINNLEAEIYKTVDENIGLEKEIRELKKKLKGKLL